MPSWSAFFFVAAVTCLATSRPAQAFVSTTTTTTPTKPTTRATTRATTTLAPRDNLTTSLKATQIDTSFMWNRGLNFGKGDFKFYRSFDDMMSVFPDDDRAEFPELFNLPTGVYEVTLTKPLGIVFEEIDAGKGLYVQDLVPDGNAAKLGEKGTLIQPGDVLVGMTAVKIVGAKYERRMIPARNFDFDTMVGAVGSNDPKWGCNDVVMLFERPNEADTKKVDEFLEFLVPPFDTPWRQVQ